MNIVDLTPFTPATFVSAKEGTGYAMTVLVKAGLGMQHGGLATPLEMQQFPSGDRYPDGADPAASSLVSASDLVPLKRRADILLAATAYRLASQPTGTFRIGIRVGKLTKQLAVSGQREFKQGIVSSSIVEGEPLAKIPVTYENAFGGPGFPQNPVGRGFKTNELPLIEYFDQRMQRPGDKPAPAGFGPIAADWQPRKSMIGTFGPDYLEKHWPGFPGDFDASYFNAAPADQQVDGYLRGDEEIVLENLHPTHATFATRLPGWRVVCTREGEDGRCALIPLVIDTLWMNPDQEQLVLIWRGRMSVQTPDALEVKRLGFLVEQLAAPLRDASYYRDRLQQLIDERDAEFAPERPPMEAVGDEQPSGEDTTEEEDEEDKALRAEIAALRAKAGHPPEEEIAPTELPPLSPEAQAKFDEIMAKIEAEDRREAEEEAAQRWTREKVVAALQQQQSLADADLSNLDLSEGDFAEADFRGAVLDGVNFARSSLTRALLASCSLQRANFDSASLDEAVLDRANLTDASLRKASLMAASLVQTDLTAAALDGANLGAIKAERAVLRGASLATADLTRANLSGAVLSEAQAAKANFTTATLVGATCDHADFSSANFQQATLHEAIFTASKLARANFNAAQVVDADFSEADLTGASFRQANCEGMWLSSAMADQADFRGASCIDLQVDGTSARQANFAECCITAFRGGQRANLSGASFRQAHGTEPIFESCVLDGADFSQANIPGANFVHAAVPQANFTAAELKGARFDHANCQEAVFVAANLFQSVFIGANLIGADISEGNFYGCELLDARISKLRFNNCNLKMTKLEQWAASRSR